MSTTMNEKCKCKYVMTWRAFHIFIMVWFFLNVLVRLPNEVCVWIGLATMYYITWQYSTVIYRATYAYIMYCLGKESKRKEIRIDQTQNVVKTNDNKDNELKELKSVDKTL